MKRRLSSYQSIITWHSASSTAWAWGFVSLAGLLGLSQTVMLMFTGCQDRGQPASWCLANSEILEKVLKQLAHWYFFTSEWVWRWARRLDRSAKARLHWRHENGFSPAEGTQSESLCVIHQVEVFCFWKSTTTNNTPFRPTKWQGSNCISQPSFTTLHPTRVGCRLEAAQLWWTEL